MGVVLFRNIRIRPDFVDTEVFVVLRNEKLCFPLEIPERFNTRTTATDIDKVFEVASIPFLHATWISQASLTTEGIWITRDDTVPRGGVAPCVFGIPLDDDVKHAWMLLPVQPPSPFVLRVGYHGTDGKCIQSISYENVLRPSFGQLGFGVYSGSFWKACRFAVRDQNYNFKVMPCVLRILWLSNTDKHLHFPKKSPCRCKDFCRGKPLEEAQVCGHELDWTKELLWDSGELRPHQFSSGKWSTRNEEWVCRPSCVQRLQQVALIDASTVDGPHYNPWQRTIRIV